MRVVTLNIRHGGGRRIGTLSAYLVATGADILVLTEFQKGARGLELCRALEGAGYQNQHSTRAEEGHNTVLIASRRRCRALRAETAPVDSDRLALVEIDDVRIAGVYFSLNKEKASLFDYLLSVPPTLDGDCLVIGDMNTGRRRMDEAGATFHCADRFERLEDRGWVDLWRQMHGAEAREWSWYSPGHGNGFRIDHAFARTSLASRATACSYDPAPLEGLTDHAALCVEFAA